MQNDISDLIGKKFGRWTVVGPATTTDYGKKRVHCRCDCGKESDVTVNNLVRGVSNSCGCYQRDRMHEIKSLDLTGHRFGSLTALRIDPNHVVGEEQKWVCECDCGNTTLVTTNALTSGNTKSCGCLKSVGVMLNDLTGRRYGRLTVLYRAPNLGKTTRWMCKCDCGNVTIVNAMQLVSGGTQSCGCLQKERAVEANTVYKTPSEKRLGLVVFPNMKRRCYSKSNIGYENYGGRGITICDEWLADRRSFVDWAMQNGYKPGLSIDRIDNNGPYSPENCRFVDVKTQNGNKRSNRNITIDGVTKNVAGWCATLGIRRNSLYRFSDEQLRDKFRERLNGAAPT